MRVVIAGAGSVGRSIARELLINGHQVLLMDKDPAAIRPTSLPDADWLHADACEIASLARAGLAECEVVVAASGDDKANLVVSLLAKTEYGVPRTVARVNTPANEWMFDEAWGVDVAVSTPRLMTALIEEAVSVGDLVRIFTFQQSHATMVEMTLPADSPLAGTRVGDIVWPPDTVLVGIVRDQRPIPPSRDDTLEGNDELMLITVPESEEPLQALLSPQRHPPAGAAAVPGDVPPAAGEGDVPPVAGEGDVPPVAGEGDVPPVAREGDEPPAAGEPV